MKLFRIVTLVLAVALTSMAAMAQKRLFDEFSNNKDITTVYISGAAMSMGIQMSGGEGEISIIKECIKNPQGMEILTAENPAGQNQIKQTLNNKIKTLGMEPFFDVSNDGSKVNIYGGLGNDGQTMKDILIEVEEEDQYVVIYIQGEIDMQKLADCLK